MKDAKNYWYYLKKKSNDRLHSSYNIILKHYFHKESLYLRLLQLQANLTDYHANYSFQRYQGTHYLKKNFEETFFFKFQALNKLFLNPLMLFFKGSADRKAILFKVPFTIGVGDFDKISKKLSVFKVILKKKQLCLNYV